ncbi:hypothetical protein GE061_004005 [Apolygus lucorum]|uniref:Transposase Tc1-like domain-containing protein n=1 Tax=Apolygus lucorum TaxID=248454 RepID=A0A8S9WY57_APOLU|nr:hypothetical protein GE061_004005 [Apolygus lucorum]
MPLLVNLALTDAVAACIYTAIRRLRDYCCENHVRTPSPTCDEGYDTVDTVQRVHVLCGDAECRDVKRQIIGLWKAKKTYREIAEALGVSKTCVEHSVNAFKETGTISEKPRSGRPRKTTERDDRAVVNLSKINRRASLPEIASEMEGFHGVSVSVSTVSRRLREVGMESRVALQKPLLNVGHRAKRRNFAREKRDWNIDMWRKVIFSDESRFELFPRRKIRVRRTKTEMR